VNFALFSRHATSVSLVLFAPGSSRPASEVRLDPRIHRTGDVWHVFVEGVDSFLEYGWRVDGPSGPLHRFDPSKVVVDPYARVLAGSELWGRVDPATGSDRLEGLVRRRRSSMVAERFDWEDDAPLNVHLADSVIYELHVAGFTRHPGSDVRHPGTFAGLMEKIPYLRELGVTAVELMPVTEFEENDNERIHPRTGERLVNFWGYHPISFFAVKASYASDPEAGGQVREFKALVKALHEAGIEVILDMVFNHTGEGDDRGPTLCLRGIDNSIYYMVDPETGAYRNYSGCGNTVNCNHPVVRDMILDALRYWVVEMHVDGFRFDLASILGRGTDGAVLSNPPLVERIAADPVLAGTKLIAEAWDAAGLYQVGTFPNWGRWAEWNGRFRDDVRKFVKGDPGQVPRLALRLAGSSDLYRPSGRQPFHSVNFVTSHDGFTLADLVSYNGRHNEENGEGNADGSPLNFSWNCGVEGPTSSPDVNRLRRRQARNLAALLLLSQGVPMVLAGDEVGRTQRGNNNAYCHDDEIGWLNWGLVDENADLLRFFKLLIRFRKDHSMLRRRSFLREEPEEAREVVWHGARAGQPDWSWESRLLGMQLVDRERGEELYLVANAHWEGVEVELPACSDDRRWSRFVDTSLDPPEEILEEGQRPVLEDQRSYPVGPRTVVVLVGK
jgi:glycogen operon protein